jgi:hypothetical protein
MQGTTVRQDGERPQISLLAESGRSLPCSISLGVGVELKRILTTWPYVAFVVGLYLGWLVFATAPLGLSAEDQTNLALVYSGTLAPFSIAGVGAVFAHRRGYDWVSVVACVVTFLLIGTVGDLIRFQHLPAWDSLLSATIIYGLIAHIGIAATLGIKKLGEPTKAARRS